MNVENYVCYGCRFDADPVRSAEVTARFAASKAAATVARLRPPLLAIVPGTRRPGMPGTASEIVRLDDICSCTATVICASCLTTRAAEAAHGRHVAHDYLDICATNGRHHDLDAIADCSHPITAIAPPAPVFCAHAKPIEDCVADAPRWPQPATPAKLARCRSCLGFHGKTGYDRCPYSRREGAAVKVSRMPTSATYSQEPLVAEMRSHSGHKIKGLRDTISHLGSASERLRRKPGRPASGTSRWARRRRRFGTAT